MKIGVYVCECGINIGATVDVPKGLHGVLYNIKSQDEWHTHNEVNGLALSGLGNRLLVNGGRLGAPTRAAYLNNTLTINGDNHDSRLGGGITSGFIAKGLDFAVGNDGSSLSSESHDRNLIMIHGDGDANGYFIVFDEVKGKAGEKIKNYLHPANQSSVMQTVALSEYTAPIDHYETVKGTSLTFYYLTPPTVVNVDKTPGAVPDRYPGYPDHNRLEAVYDINSEGSKNLATLIFPHDFNHPKADFQKISIEEFHGVIANQDGTSDFILESMAEKEITSNEISFTAIKSLNFFVRCETVITGLSISINHTMKFLVKN